MGVAGGSAIVEHPGLFGLDARANIWQLPVMQHFERLNVVEVVQLDQCMFGQDHRAPTRFMTLRAPAFGAAARASPGAGRCTATLLRA